MQSLPDRIAKADALLAPWAATHGGGLGRPVAEPADPLRSPFQRDRGRIIHSQAFRRLQGKTQVFVAGEGDHFRTRLTHTMEVAQLSRDIARALRLNEDLAECIALAHDLGHPPFGHKGEEALDAWMKAHGAGFEHNAQSLRIVTVLEEHAHGAPGLNLNREILEGLEKHTRHADQTHRGLSLEAQAVNLADEIAYSAHDCEDGLRAGLFSMDDLNGVPLAAEAETHSLARATSIRGALIQMLVTDLYTETEARLARANIRTLDDVYAAREPLVELSAEMRPWLAALRAFLWKHMYSHARVRGPGEEGQEVIRTLCDALLAAPSPKIESLRARTGSTLTEAVKDYVAGMTDAFARRESPSA